MVGLDPRRSLESKSWTVLPRSCNDSTGVRFRFNRGDVSLRLSARSGSGSIWFMVGLWLNWVHVRVGFRPWSGGI